MPPYPLIILICLTITKRSFVNVDSKDKGSNNNKNKVASF
jgi:hypothetical protein